MGRIIEKVRNGRQNGRPKWHTKKRVTVSRNDKVK